MSGTSKAIPSGALKLTASVLMEMENLPVEPGESLAGKPVTLAAQGAK